MGLQFAYEKLERLTFHALTPFVLKLQDMQWAGPKSTMVQECRFGVEQPPTGIGCWAAKIRLRGDTFFCGRHNEKLTDLRLCAKSARFIALDDRNANHQ